MKILRKSRLAAKLPDLQTTVLCSLQWDIRIPRQLECQQPLRDRYRCDTANISSDLRPIPHAKLLAKMKHFGYDPSIIIRHDIDIQQFIDEVAIMANGHRKNDTVVFVMHTKLHSI